MAKERPSLLDGELLDETRSLSLGDLCRTCRVSAERVMELVEEGIVEPEGEDPKAWRFQAVSVRRVRCAVRLERDLGVNAPGAALALDLLDELQRLRARLRWLDD